MKKFINSLQISTSVIGAIIGAGFITGREIMRFFYASNWFFSVVFTFLVLFCTVYFILKVTNEKSTFLLEKSSVIIYSFNILIMASMLGATDSLAYNLFNISSQIPVFSILLLAISTFCCLCGIDRLTRINFVLVPVLLLIFFLNVLSLPKNNQNMFDFKQKTTDFLTYGYMNVLLAQPFLLKIKKEKNEFSPFVVAFISSLILSLAIGLFLTVLSDECLTCDIPLILLIKSNFFIYCLLSLIIFLSIFTTLTSVQYPFFSVNKKYGWIILVIVSLVSFTISRMGFYVIVDKIYPAIAIFSVIYYAFIFATWLYFSLKGQQGHTLFPPIRTKSPYSPLQDQVLVSVHRKR